MLWASADLNARGQLPDQAVMLVPLACGLIWLHIRPVRGRVAFAVLITVLCAGSAGGPFQTDMLLNRVSHAVMSGLICAAAIHELRRLLSQAPTKTLVVCAAAVALSAGTGMELLEAVSDWNTNIPAQRYRDTIADLLADLAGIAIVVMGFSVRKHHDG